MPAGNRRLTATPGVNHTPRKPVESPLNFLSLGNFNVIDAVDVFPQLAEYPYKGEGDSRAHVGAIVPIRNDTNGFTGLQLLSAPHQTGKYTVQGFTTNQISKLKFTTH